MDGPRRSARRAGAHGSAARPGWASGARGRPADPGSDTAHVEPSPLPGADDAAPDLLAGLNDVERLAALTWIGENLTELRRSVSGQRLLYWSLGVGFVVGLAAHVGGYLLRSSVTTEPLGLVPTCSMRSVGHSGPVSSWSCSSRSIRRQNGGS
jgi:hypothetical protein